MGSLIRLVVVPVAAALAAAVMPATAHASVVTVSGAKLTYFADLAETNNVTITFLQLPFPSRYRISDPGAAINVVSPCTLAADGTARCPAAGITSMDIIVRDGNDTVTNNTATASFIWGDGTPTFPFGTGADTLTGGSGADTLNGGPDGDTLNGGDGDDVLDGGGGGDGMTGQGGTDTIDYSARTAALVVSAGDAQANDGESGEGDYVGQDIEVVKGGSGDDEFYAWAGIVRFEGGVGADEFFERASGTPVSDGGAGPDRFFGGTIDYSGRTNAVTVLMDGSANDGEPGEGDFVSHGKVVGGSGDDMFVGFDSGGGVFVGGPGSDDFSRGTVDYSDRADAVTVTFDGVANDGRTGEADNVRADMRVVIGGSGNDRLTGSSAGNELRGGPGDDRLDGGLGEDLLDGGSGFDIVDYSARTGSLSVTLNQFGPPDDGEVGEGDRVLPTSNMILGGSGHDLVCTCDSNLENERYGAAGGEGNDSLAGGHEDDTFRGGPGADTLYGSGGHDVLDGGPGNDNLQGLEDDLLDGGTGADVIGSAFVGGFADYSTRTAPVTVTIDDVANDGEAGEGDNVRVNGLSGVLGGSGNDTLVGSARAETLRGRGGNDSLDGFIGRDTLDGGEGIDTASYARHTGDYAPVTVSLDGVANDGGAQDSGDSVTVENVVGSQGGDTLIGDAGANVLDGGPGNDTLDGGLGGDTLVGGDGTDLADYSARTTGVDVAIGGPSSEGDAVQADVENLRGGSGADKLVGSAAPNVLSGGAGNDTLDGDAGADRMNGGDGTDTADYSRRSASVAADLDGVADDGEAGEGDEIEADVENLTGGSGADRLFGNGGVNTLVGGPGNDVLDGAGAGDVFVGGEGSDFVDYSSRENPVVVDIGGGTNDGETGEGDDVRSDVENVRGGSGNDTLTGNDGPNLLRGGGGTDVLDGRDGNDVLHTRDTTQETPVCGPGTDRHEADSFDNPGLDCETQTVRDAVTNVTPPSISGDLLSGATQTADLGTWTGDGLVFAYQWYRCDDIGNCDAIAQATGQTYIASSSDVVFHLQVAVTATNDDDSVTALSPQTPTIAGGPLPELSIGDVAVSEGDSGMTTATFKVSLSTQSGDVVSVEYTTVAGTATVGSDFVATSGTLTFAPGERQKSVVVSVIGDTVDEPDETFALSLANPAFATVADAQGSGTIRDDDVPGPGGSSVPGCDIAGTAGNDVITGTAKAERICGLGGNDVIRGLGGNDVLIGGKGNDRLIGGGGKDRFLGGAGKDFLAMKDRTKEFGDGGPGIDTATINRGDKLKRVEKRR